MCIGKNTVCVKAMYYSKKFKNERIDFYEKNKHKKFKCYRGVQDDERHYDNKQDLQYGLS